MAVPCPSDVNLELKITRWQDLDTSKYNIKFTVGTVTGIDKNVFVFKQLLSRNVTTGVFDSVFEAIATPQAMADFKAEEPNPGQVFWRDDILQLEFDSISAATETEALIKADIEQLIEDTKILLADFQTETVLEL